jgi:hypothetical protein
MCASRPERKKKKKEQSAGKGILREQGQTEQHYRQHVHDADCTATVVDRRRMHGDRSAMLQVFVM